MKENGLNGLICIVTMKVNTGLNGLICIDGQKEGSEIMDRKTRIIGQ